MIRIIVYLFNYFNLSNIYLFSVCYIKNIVFGVRRLGASFEDDLDMIFFDRERKYRKGVAGSFGVFRGWVIRRVFFWNVGFLK